MGRKRQTQPHRTYQRGCYCLAIERGFQRTKVGRIAVPYAKVMRVQTSGKLDVKVVDALKNHYVCVVQQFSLLR